MKKESYDAMAQQVNLILPEDERTILDKFQGRIGFEDREMLDLLILFASKFNSAAAPILRNVHLPATVNAKHPGTGRHNPKKKK
jgi:hypothetical protein